MEEYRRISVVFQKDTAQGITDHAIFMPFIHIEMDR